MDVYGVIIPYKPLTNFELLDFGEKLNLRLRGVFMRDTLPHHVQENEYGIVNFNKVSQNGTHWVCYYKEGGDKTYFDSFGQVVLQEIRDYLKSPIYRNTDIIQPINSPICGHLCLYVLKSLSEGRTFRETLNSLEKVGGGGGLVKWSSPLADELHHPLRKNFQKRGVFVRHVDDVFGADLVDMRAISKQNKGFKYILMVMDVFSKYGWGIPLKFKTGDAVKAGLEKIFKEQIPKKIWADKGTEFYNEKVAGLLAKHDIVLYSTENEEKCSVIERWNRTVKTKLWKYFTANKTHKWEDVLDLLIQKYNTVDKHRSIGMTPIEARKPANYARVFRNLYEARMRKLGAQKPKFKVGEKVRLAVKKDHFEKSYIINWSDKIYTVKQVLTTRPITYIVEDDREEQHKGTFYEQELQATAVSVFRIQKILRYKRSDGKRYALVRWMDYDSSYNSWVPVEDLQQK